jgi:HEAT repeat
VMVTGGDAYGDRRGAALGLAAYVKAVGIPSLKQHDIVNRLKDICEQGSVNNRQGSLFAFECLSDRLGLLFEPVGLLVFLPRNCHNLTRILPQYIITIMPVLLKSFSHSSDHVREAAADAANVIMAKLSAHGVKQVLTPLLSSLPTETAWKSRQEAIRLLGTMAHCAPRQLAACLPQIVPRLVEAVADSHPKVKESAKAAMADITSVIKNPEISLLCPVLLAALGDPANKTKDALAALLDCEFMHSIDAPSLGILIPILGRSLKDRSADIKRKSSAITGNICSMITDPKIIIPYFPQMMPGLKNCLIDPIPDVRATSAKALGSLVLGVGEADLPELIPWLMETLKSETSPVERSGAAQGLAEVSLSLSSSRRLEILTAVTRLQSSTKVAAREGMIWALSFFPSVLGEQYSVYISFTLPIVLQGLCDDNEGVREVSLRAGQVMVSVLGRAHTLELLPALSVGSFDDHLTPVTT